MTREEKMYQDAYIADLRAREYALKEKLQKCQSWEELRDINNELGLIENKILCFETRQMLHDCNKVNSIYTLRGRWDSCEKEIHFVKR
jgi:hypothetical protein